MNRHKKIIITGSSGFLGSHLVERLKDDERFEVYAMTSKPEELKNRLGGENVRYVHKDALDGIMLKDSVVISCAYPRNSNGVAIADGLKYIQQVFESAVESEAKAIINISSQSVYSQQRTKAATEETPVSLESSYAVGKYAVELLLESIGNGSNTSFTNLRMASLIGPGFDQRIVNRFVKQALSVKSITVKRNQQKFGYLDVIDAAEGILAMLTADITELKCVYNLGVKGAYSLIEIANVVRDVLNEDMSIEVEIDQLFGEETGSSEMNCALFFNDTKWHPRIHMSDSIRSICEYEVDR